MKNKNIKINISEKELKQVMFWLRSIYEYSSDRHISIQCQVSEAINDSKKILEIMKKVVPGSIAKEIDGISHDKIIYYGSEDWEGIRFDFLEDDN